MKQLILIILIPLLVCTCTNEKRDMPSISWHDLELEEPLKHVVDSFTYMHNDCDLYELYIDKVTADSCVVTLSTASQLDRMKRLLGLPPIGQIRSNGKKVNVYCGIEPFVHLVHSIPPDSLTNGGIGGVQDMIIILHHGKIDILRQPSFPFGPTYPQTVKFTPPVIKQLDQ